MSGWLETQWLGRVPYEEGLRLQEHWVVSKAEDPALPDRLLLLEHEPVYTLGRSMDPESVGGPQGLPYPVIQTNRGGKATFHGPGQLVGYPILDLRRRGQDLHRHLRTIEDGLIELCARVGVQASARPGLTGVWVGERKLASIGVGVRRWISMHGFALNVCGELEGFQRIIPCGLEGVEMTSLEKEGASVGQVEVVAGLTAEVFGSRLALS
jgi:lipoyl(octanoyl) transferase